MSYEQPSPIYAVLKNIDTIVNLEVIFTLVHRFFGWTPWGGGFIFYTFPLELILARNRPKTLSSGKPFHKDNPKKKQTRKTTTTTKRCADCFSFKPLLTKTNEILMLINFFITFICGEVSKPEKVKLV